MDYQTQCLESHIYKVILANYSELNDFILYNHPNVSRAGYSERGLSMEVIPNHYKWYGILGSYAKELKDIREDLLRKSVYYRGTFEAFQPEFEPLLALYKELLTDINVSRGKVNVSILEIIKKFLFSLDIEFQTNNYFFKRIAEYYILRSLSFFDIDQKPMKGLRINISSNNSPLVIQKLKTDGKGLVICELTSGKYVVKIVKFNETREIEIKEFDNFFEFMLKMRKTGFFRRYKSVPSLEQDKHLTETSKRWQNLKQIHMKYRRHDRQKNP